MTREQLLAQAAEQFDEAANESLAALFVRLIWEREVDLDDLCRFVAEQLVDNHFVHKPAFLQQVGEVYGKLASIPVSRQEVA